ncbi:MBL fold metallo-hydrolase [Legionella brunensis]|uniref:Outer membrane protein RomA n=1 Tax=Legionella brunensis TaxID=29422 RepID=A0A0W0SE90_9GAMM|nr:MBL fold metallo-hydrolase [Legionella brunensis]KTC81483.1 outer membrane protein RomA [Legionella brunensis]
MPIHTKKINQRSLRKKSINEDVTDLLSNNLHTFVEEFFINDQEKIKEVLSPERRADGRYVTSEANLNKFIDLRIFRETQIKGFLRWLTSTPPLLRVFFTWVFITKMRMKLAYFDQQENNDPAKIYKQGPEHAINNDNSETFTIHNLGHATQLIQTSGMNILTDPVFGDLAPFVYPAMTRSLGQDVKAEELPSIDVILISHNHRDHVDTTSLKKLLVHQPQLLVPAGDEEFFRSLGFTKVQAFEWHEQITITSKTDKKVTFCSVPADHRSGRNGHDSHHSLVTGWTISPKERREILYFAGDTARINNARMTGLALDIYHLYQHKKGLEPSELPRLINMEPGGPNYTRKDMSPTHQSAVDSVVSSFRLALALEEISCKDKGIENQISASAWLESTATIFMHQNKYELGPDRFNENYFIFTRLCSYLQMSDETLEVHKQKQESKSTSWSLFHRRKDFIISGVEELKEMAKTLWPNETPATQRLKIIEFITSRTHFPLIREKLTSEDPYKFAPGEISTIAPDTWDSGKQKLKGAKDLSLDESPTLISALSMKK